MYNVACSEKVGSSLRRIRMAECEAADKLIAKLPIDRDSDEEKEQRKAMFKEFDPNGNGYLSYSEASSKI